MRERERDSGGKTYLMEREREREGKGENKRNRWEREKEIVEVKRTSISMKVLHRI